jgi:PTS system fructose-specific IIC component
MTREDLPSVATQADADLAPKRFGGTQEKQLLDAFFKVSGAPDGQPYFSPSAATWVSARYAETSLQRQRKDRAKPGDQQIFFETGGRGDRGYALKAGLAATIASDPALLPHGPVPLVALGAWMYRSEEVQSAAELVARAKADRSAQRTGPYKHLMTGVSYMLPIIVAGGLSLALAFAFGGIPQPGQEYPEGSLAWAFTLIGGGAAFGVFVGVLSAFIAYSIADRPGIAPGLIGGLLASTIGAGFLGGIVSGFLAGYLVKFLADNLRLPSVLAGLMPVLILPFVGTVVVGLAMVYLIGPPVAAVLAALTAWLQGLGTGNAVVLGLILGAMMAFDMGGPVNKAAYAFSLGLLGSQIFTPIAAVMAAGMTPPLGLALAAFLFRNRFDAEEREAAKPAVVLGLAFITEGAIPFAAKDPIRVIPSLMLGSATAAALSMYFNVGLRAPHGGVFVLPIPNAVTSLGLYALAILAGTLVTALALFILKRPLNRRAAQQVDDGAAVAV